MPVKRIIQKIQVGRRLRKNRFGRADSSTKWDNGVLVVKRLKNDKKKSTDTWRDFVTFLGDKIEDEFTPPRQEYRASRNRTDRVHAKAVRTRASIQRTLNKSRGKGKNSPYKLTGLGKDAAWEKAIQNRINERQLTTRRVGTRDYQTLSGHDVAEIVALEKWLRKSPEKRKEMEDWLKKHKEALKRSGW